MVWLAGQGPADLEAGAATASGADPEAYASAASAEFATRERDGELCKTPEKLPRDGLDAYTHVRPADAPVYRLVVHRVDGSVRVATSGAQFVRTHVVDADTGRWRWKVYGEACHAVFNMDHVGAPYLRMTPRRQEPWNADVGQSPSIRPFSTAPCSLQADRRGVVRVPPTWDEGFLIIEPLQPDMMLLFEVLDYVEERPRDLDGETATVYDADTGRCAWCFLNIDSALTASSGSRPRRLRLQLFKYQRLAMRPRGRHHLLDLAGIGRHEADSPDAHGRPAVYEEFRATLRRSRRSLEEGHRNRLSAALAFAAEKLGSNPRQQWPAVLEISLMRVGLQADIDKVTDALKSELGETRIGSAGGPSATDHTCSPGLDEAGATGDDPAEVQSALNRHHVRHRDQPCAMVDDLLWQFTAGERGAYRLSISPAGQLLAAALARQGGSSELRIFNLAIGRVQAIAVAAHDAMVYDLCWHVFAGRHGPQHQLLISCSGDGIVQLFEVPDDPKISIVQALRPHATLYMPSHAYSVRPHPALSADPQQVVLACGGHGFGLTLCRVVRTRQLDGEEASNVAGIARWKAVMPHWQEQVVYEDFRQHPDILCVRFSSQPTSPDNLYASDATGHVMLFQVRFDATPDVNSGAGGGVRAVFVRKYIARELEGVPIYCLDVVTPQLIQGRRLSRVQLSTVDDWVLLYSRDHLIRLASLQRGVLRIEKAMSGHECHSYPLVGSMSPDGAYVVCGSETGELKMWNVEDGKLLPAKAALQVQLAGPVIHAVWSEHHHLLACCALDDEAPPVLVFVGGDPDYVPPPASLAAPQRPLRTVPDDAVARTLMDQQASSPDGLTGGTPDWAIRWVNSNDNPRSAVSLEGKRQMKENILLQLLERKGAEELERHFGSMHGVPGAM